MFKFLILRVLSLFSFRGLGHISYIEILIKYNYKIINILTSYDYRFVRNCLVIVLNKKTFYFFNLD